MVTTKTNVFVPAEKGFSFEMRCGKRCVLFLVVSQESTSAQGPGFQLPFLFFSFQAHSYVSETGSEYLSLEVC
jgi:hypothetical protein